MDRRKNKNNEIQHEIQRDSDSRKTKILENESSERKLETNSEIKMWTNEKEINKF